MRKKDREYINSFKDQLSNIYTSLLNDTIEMDIAELKIKLAQKAFDITLLQMERDTFYREKRSNANKKKKSNKL